MSITSASIRVHQLIHTADQTGRNSFVKWNSNVLIEMKTSQA